MEQEAFMKDISWLNQLKLRASYGSLGNNAVGNYDYQLYYQASNYVLNDALQIGMAQRALSNAALTWETSYVTNFGVDFALFSKLSGTIDAFVKNTKGILIELPAPLVHGNATVPKSNAAEVRNRGVELSLNWNDKVGSVNYFVGGNFSFVKNKVTKFKGDEMSLNGTNMILEGEPINVQYVLSVDRIIQTEEDMAIVEAMEANNPDAFKQYKKPEYGDFLYKDIDGDGCITDNDKIKVGNGTNPTFTFGFNFGANWKGWDFSCILFTVYVFAFCLCYGFLFLNSPIGLFFHNYFIFFLIVIIHFAFNIKHQCQNHYYTYNSQYLVSLNRLTHFV